MILLNRNFCHYVKRNTIENTDFITVQRFEQRMFCVCTITLKCIGLFWAFARILRKFLIPATFLLATFLIDKLFL